LVQHRIDLFSAGLEYNPGAGVSLTDSREALLRYRSSPDPLYRIRNTLQVGPVKAAGGVYATVKDDLVRLFTLSSPSRGIQHREWEIPFPAEDLRHYGLYPGADVIAFVKLPESRRVRLSL
jgi:hypothetical protein